jgi:tRNA1(Val) A37 N6-methylase TrmN6
MTIENSIIETTLLRGRVKLLQPVKGFHASIDSVFLGAAVPARAGWKILDVGCGVGSAGLCVLAREKKVQLTGIDVQEELIDLAHQNATLNDTECRFFSGDIKTEKHVEDNFFNVVMMNPPYQEGGTHTPSPAKIKALSHGEDASGASLEDWVKYAHKKLKQGGHLVVIHRADRLDDVILALEKRRWFGSIRIYPLWSHDGEDAKRVIVSARKERYAPLKLKSGMIIHEKDGKYASGARKILDAAEAIDF